MNNTKKLIPEYLNSLEELESAYPLDSSASLKFHWSNWNTSCNYKKKLVSNEFLASIKRHLQKKKVWLKFNHDVKESNLYSLYNYYLNVPNPKIKIVELFISLHSENGPYLPYADLEWIDQNSFKQMIYFIIFFEGKRKRDFRLSWFSKILCPELEDINIFTHCFSSKGILFKLKRKRNHNQNNLYETSSSKTIDQAASTHKIEKISSENLILQINLNPFRRSLLVEEHHYLEKLKTEDFSNSTCQKNLSSFMVEKKYFNHLIKELRDQKKSNQKSEKLIFLPYDKIMPLERDNLYATLNRFLFDVRNVLEKKIAS